MRYDAERESLVHSRTESLLGCWFVPDCGMFRERSGDQSGIFAWSIWLKPQHMLSGRQAERTRSTAGVPTRDFILQRKFAKNYWQYLYDLRPPQKSGSSSHIPENKKRRKKYRHSITMYCTSYGAWKTNTLLASLARIEVKMIDMLYMFVTHLGVTTL